MKTIHLHISGLVQGVFFRASAKEQSDALGITGWVKNKTDGTVEVCACGTETNLQKFIDWCHKGPPAARVEDVQVLSDDDEQIFDEFTILQ